MKIHDYETGRTLRDIDIELTRGEAEELASYLTRMLEREDLKTVHMTDIDQGVIARELSVSIQGSAMVA